MVKISDLKKLVTLCKKNKYDNKVWVNNKGMCIGDVKSENDDLSKSVLFITDSKFLKILTDLIPNNKMILFDEYITSKLGSITNGDGEVSIESDGIVIKADVPWKNSKKEVITPTIHHKISYEDDEIITHRNIKFVNELNSDEFKRIDISFFSKFKSHEFKDIIPEEDIFIRLSTTHICGRLKNSLIYLNYKRVNEDNVLVCSNVVEKSYKTYTFLMYTTLK